MIFSDIKQNNVGNKQPRGFSLVEVLIYMSLLVVLLNAAIITLLSLDTTIARNQAERVLTNSARVTFERMLQDIRSADSVDVAASTLGSSPGVLTLIQGATTTRFYISTSSIAVSVNGVEKGPLTADSIAVDRLIFSSYLGTNSNLVRIEMQLSVNTKAASSTRTYYTSAVLRGSYD